jgi:sugar/nucleoside kinase (ribokinase family)
VIVVIGAVRLRETDGRAEAVGLAASIAAAAASAGAKVELVGRVGDDPPGDALILALARAGIGHVAVIRDAAHRTPVIADGGEDPASDDDTGAPADPAWSTPMDLEGADAELALRYLPDIRVIVAVHVPAEVSAQAVAAAGWASAALIVVVPPSGEPSAGDLPDTATSIALDDDAGSLGGAAIGRFVAALDRGTDGRAAWDELLAAVRAAG